MSDGDSEKDKRNAALRKEDNAAALKHYDKAIKKAGSGAGAALFSNKADDFERDKGNAAFDMEDFATALKHYDKATAAAGSSADAALFSNKAGYLISCGCSWATAILIQDAFKAALLNLKKYDVCIQQCLKGLAAPGLTTELKSKMANAYGSQDKFGKAMDALKNCEFSPVIVDNCTDLLWKLWNHNREDVRAFCTSRLKQARSSGVDLTHLAMLYLAMEDPGQNPKPSRSQLIHKYGRFIQLHKDVTQFCRVRFPRPLRPPDDGLFGHICTALLCDLKPITIGEMRLNMVNVGRVLLCRTITEPVMLNALAVLVEDPTGDVIRLLVYNRASINEDLNKILPMGTYLAIKEPCSLTDAFGSAAVVFTLVLRVDNPSDLVYLEQTHSLLKSIEWLTPLPLAPAAASFENVDLRSWEALQKRGNELFVAGDYGTAITAYTNAIELKREEAAPNELADLFSNRAAAYLNDEKPMDAYWDCQSALFVQPGHLKATFRLAKAHAAMSKYEEAKEVLDKSPHTTRPEFKTEISRVNRLLREWKYGEYDLKTLLKETAASKTPRLDHADYNGGVEVRWISQEKGNGLVALRDFSPGDLLFVNKAFEATYKSECADAKSVRQMTHGTCVERVMRRISKNNDLVKQLYRLYAGPYFERCKDVFGKLSQPSLTDGDNEPTFYYFASVEESETFVNVGVIPAPKRPQLEECDAPFVVPERINAIVSFNSIGTDDAQEDKHCVCEPKEGDLRAFHPVRTGFLFPGCGIWLLASFMNHSCVPNTSIFFAGDVMFVRAAKIICKGEELTMAYTVGSGIGYYTRQGKLAELYGFQCECALCVCDLKRSVEDLDLEIQRKSLMDLHRAKLTSCSFRSDTEYFNKLVQLEASGKYAKEMAGRLSYKDRYDPCLQTLGKALGTGYNWQEQYLKAAKAFEMAYFASTGNGTQADDTFRYDALARDELFLCFNISENYLHSGKTAKAKEYLAKMLRAAKVCYGSHDLALLEMLYPELPLRPVTDALAGLP